MNLFVNFDFDSSALSTDTRITLDQLAKALQSAHLAGQRFVIAGHTDAVGTAEYNQELSMRRAEAVRGYLVSSEPIAGERLSAVGFCFSKPMNVGDPNAPENRRVEITRKEE